MSTRSSTMPLRVTVALVAGALTSTTVFVTAQQRSNTPPSTESAPAVLTGCVERAPEAGGFVLRVAPPSPTRTSAATGTSATGDAPSGRVTGQTPTGATATTTASPTPAVGTPEATANPASPTYNRTPDAPGATVGSTDTEAQTGAALYRLEARDGVALDAQVGRLVEVRGTMAGLSPGTEPCCAGLQGPTARAHEPEAKQPRAGVAGTSGATVRDTRAPSLPIVSVTSVTRLAATCSR